MLAMPQSVPSMDQPGPSMEPQVPPGWAVRWNDQYQTWFYVNTYTSVSQWHPPTEPVYPPGPPMASTPAIHQPQMAPQHHSMADDEAFAMRLQAEEDAMSRTSNHNEPVPPHPPRPHSAVGVSNYDGVYDNHAHYNGGVYASSPYGSSPSHSGSFTSNGPPIDPSLQQPSQQGNKQSGFLGKVYDKVGGKLAVAGAGAGVGAYGAHAAHSRPSSAGNLSPYSHEQHQYPPRPTSAGGYYSESPNAGGMKKKSSKKKYLSALGLGAGGAAALGGAGAVGYGAYEGASSGKDKLSKYSEKYGHKIANKLFKDSGHGEENGGEEGGEGGDEDDGGWADLGEGLGEAAGDDGGEGIGEVIGAIFGV